MTIYPPANFASQPAKESIFKALYLTRLSDVRVVILGHDPYFSEGQATGLAFAVPNGDKRPMSLGHIAREIERSTGQAMKATWDLVDWAKQGVLLLNTSLTVKDGLPGSHRSLGWKTFTDEVLNLVVQQDRDIFFCLWGKPARKKKNLLLNTNPEYILEACHPSRPKVALPHFSGCGHFATINDHLVPKISW